MFMPVKERDPEADPAGAQGDQRVSIQTLDGGASHGRPLRVDRGTLFSEVSSRSAEFAVRGPPETDFEGGMRLHEL